MSWPEQRTLVVDGKIDGRAATVHFCPTEAEATRRCELGQVAFGPAELMAFAMVARVFPGARIMAVKR